MTRRAAAGAGRQQTMKDVIPPLTLPQERAMEFLEKKRLAAKAAEVAKDAESDMIHAAQKAGVDSIKVRDDDNKLIVFQLDNKIAIKRTVMTDTKIEKAETQAAAAAGAGGAKA